MFIGHFAAGLALKKAEPKLSLGWLFISVQLLDLIWPVLTLAGFEKFAIAPGITQFTPLDFQHYPYSHSLVASIGWGALLAILFYFFNKNSRAAGVLFLGVTSHWVLDYITHRPDMPVLLSGPKVGLGLWNSFAGTMIVETGMFIIGIWCYLSVIRFSSKAAKISFWVLMTFLFVINIGNAFGPVPPSESAVSYSALMMWLIVIWAFFVDQNTVKA
ncbi:MAG: metal-dependent hydrolase [Leptospiraceae bacterium]|nr:metal-dependent hydrolase [Leptospiraceae bacterium]